MSDTHIPFTVTAYLFQGAAFDSRFGVGLDSLLASSIRKREKAEQYLSGRELDGGLAARDVRIVELPLAKCLRNEEFWHWQSTMATIVDNGIMNTNNEEVGFFIQHTDIHALEQTANFNAYPPKISEQRGRYRARKTPIVRTMGQSVIWNAIGSPQAVYDLLKDIPSIGQRRTSGEGAIRKWEVEETNPESLNLFAHSIDGSNLSRPCSSECLQAINAEAGIMLNSSTQRVGYRPPYWHFGNIEELQAPPFRFA